MDDRYLAHLEFELAYLALLTKYKIKRLSRWEKRLDPEATAILRDLGLEVGHVERRLFLGRKTYETVFSMQPRWIDLYRSRFGGRRVKESADEARLKGFLFGYPACCVEAFIERPYSANGLLPADQAILFHWACSACKATPLLLREYRKIHDECLRFHGGHVRALHPYYGRKARAGSGLLRLARQAALPAAAGLSSLLLLPQVGSPHASRSHASGEEVPSDPHILAVSDDVDGDYLSYFEELTLGLDPYTADIEADSIPSGVARAYALCDLICDLSWHWLGDPDIPENRPYVLDFAMCGIVECPICGELINMGYTVVVNPVTSQQEVVYYMDLHFMEHGGLSVLYPDWYGGPVHEWRVNVPKLVSMISDSSGQHLKLQNTAVDPDRDGLASSEEIILGSDPDDWDTDGNSIYDGPQRIDNLLPTLQSLPRQPGSDGSYIVENLMRGTETCDVCGATFNMGCLQVVNPLEGLSVDVPIMALHYLTHGSFIYRGSANDGRVLPVLLRTVLTGDGTSHWLEVDGDGDGDGLCDEEESHFSLDPLAQDTDGDGTPDGPQLAMLMADAIDGLPEGPLPDTTYVTHHPVYGIYNCLICNEAINMGYLQVVNARTAASVDIPYYSLHFMRCGSFSTDRAALYPRIDPRDIDNVMDVEWLASAPPVRPGTSIVQIWPNPFMKSVTIRLDQAVARNAEIAIYDASGRHVRDLSPNAGEGAIFSWDGTDREGRNLTPGVYFCKITSGEITLSKKVMLLR
jgi:hypothetical protein